MQRIIFYEVYERQPDGSYTRKSLFPKKWYWFADWERDCYVSPLSSIWWHILFGRTIAWYIIWPVIHAFCYMGLMKRKDGDYWWNTKVVPLGEQRCPNTTQQK